jgi:hypothetical protein
MLIKLYQCILLEDWPLWRIIWRQYVPIGNHRFTWYCVQMRMLLLRWLSQLRCRSWVIADWMILVWTIYRYPIALRYLVDIDSCRWEYVGVAIHRFSHAIILLLSSCPAPRIVLCLLQLLSSTNYTVWIRIHASGRIPILPTTLPTKTTAVNWLWYLVASGKAGGAWCLSLRGPNKKMLEHRHPLISILENGLAHTCSYCQLFLFCLLELNSVNFHVHV